MAARSSSQVVWLAVLLVVAVVGYFVRQHFQTAVEPSGVMISATAPTPTLPGKPAVAGTPAAPAAAAPASDTATLLKSALAAAETEEVDQSIAPPPPPRNGANPGARVPPLKHGNLAGHTDATYDACASPVGGQMLTAGLDGTARLWEGPRLVRTFAGHDGPLFACAFSRDGRRIATGGRDSYVLVWDAQTGAVLAMLPGHSGNARSNVRSMAFLPDGNLLTTDGWGVIHRWDVAREREAARLEGHRPPTELNYGGEVPGLVVTRDGSRAFSAGSDDRVIAWDLKTNRPLWKQDVSQPRVIYGFGGVVLSPDESRIYTFGHQQPLQEWDPASGKELRKIEALSNTDAMVMHPDGKRAAVARGDNLYVFTIGTAGEPAAEIYHADVNLSARRLAFSADGRFLYAAHGNDPSRPRGLGAPWEPPTGHVYWWDLGADPF